MSEVLQYTSDGERAPTIIYAGYLVDRDELEAWSTKFAEVDATYKECLENGCRSKKAYGGIQGYLVAKQLDRQVGQSYIPIPGHGHCSLSCESFVFIFYRRRGHACGLETFRNWAKYQENQKDLVIKNTLEAMGIPLQSWSIVALGPARVEYNLSQERFKAEQDRIINLLEHGPRGPCQWPDDDNSDLEDNFDSMVL
ncbi:hypothetical protein FRC11_010949 [Ceratobasidium sp. 423]|nr:hypothetical protein FRC11_010949 [Ceratobasidium sp. 423]